MNKIKKNKKKILNIIMILTFFIIMFNMKTYVLAVGEKIEIKDGGDNPNMHHKIQDVDKIKEQAKDDVMKNNQTNYLKIVNKKNEDFLKYLSLARENSLDDKDKAIYMVEKDLSIDELNKIYTEGYNE